MTKKTKYNEDQICVFWTRHQSSRKLPDEITFDSQGKAKVDTGDSWYDWDIYLKAHDEAEAIHRLPEFKVRAYKQLVRCKVGRWCRKTDKYKRTIGKEYRWLPMIDYQGVCYSPPAPSEYLNTDSASKAVGKTIAALLNGEKVDVRRSDSSFEVAATYRDGIKFAAVEA